MAENTPESDLGSIECFQNYTAPEVFIQGLAGIVDQQDVEAMIRAQKQMLQRFEKTNEMLSNCNTLSVNRLKLAQAEFKKHTTLLVDLRKDIDSVFKRIKTIKAKLSTQYPEAFSAAPPPAQPLGEIEEDQVSLNSVNDNKPNTHKSVESITPTHESNNDNVIKLRHKVKETEDDDTSEDIPERKTLKRANSSSSDSNNGNSNNDSSPYTSDTG
uniref:KxDL domain-containing protein n=1 Tax=Clastoptera arizonana TaxID=38151 RepID=A0A1B6ECN0_9HEMI